MNDCIEGNVYYVMIVRIELNARTEIIIRKRNLMSMTMTIMMSTMVDGNSNGDDDCDADCFEDEDSILR